MNAWRMPSRVRTPPLRPWTFKFLPNAQKRSRFQLQLIQMSHQCRPRTTWTAPIPDQRARSALLLFPCLTLSLSVHLDPKRPVNLGSPNLVRVRPWLCLCLL